MKKLWGLFATLSISTLIIIAILISKFINVVGALNF